MKTSRRTFLSGAAAVAASGAVVGTARAQNLLDSIINSPRRGNWSDQFDARVSERGVVSTNSPIFSDDTIASISQAISYYEGIVQRGGWPQVPARMKLELGKSHADVEVLRRRLMVSGDLDERAGFSQSFDTYVDAAVKRFQARHGLPADGITGRYTFAAINVPAHVRLGQLQTNLDRVAAKAGQMEPRYVLVNIPAASIEAVENGRVISRHKGVVGKIDRQTPILDSKINEVIVNPYWNAPESIVRKDIIPLMRKNPNYLKDNSIRILGPNGEVDPMTIDWSTEEAAKLRFRQDPGKINAMASVKINFPNSHAVYMHDTPQQSLFNDIERFHSSGCVRVQNVRDLVSWLLQGTPDWDRARFEQTIKTGESVPVQLGNPTPVHFAYVSAWSTSDGVAHFRDDIYGLDGARELMLSSAI